VRSSHWMRSSAIDYGGDVGLRQDGGTLSVQSSTFAHNPTAILLGATTSAAQVLDSDFMANAVCTERTIRL
jgi:hypothetical protein